MPLPSLLKLEECGLSARCASLWLSNLPPTCDSVARRLFPATIFSTLYSTRLAFGGTVRTYSAMSFCLLYRVGVGVGRVGTIKNDSHSIGSKF